MHRRWSRHWNSPSNRRKPIVHGQLRRRLQVCKDGALTGMFMCFSFRGIRLIHCRHRKTPRQSFTTQLSETYTKANIPQQSYRTVSSPRPQRVQQQDSAQARQQASIPCDGSSDTTKYQRHERDPHGGRPEATPRNNTATEQSETSVGAVPFIAATPVTNIVSKSDRLTSKEYILRPVSSNSRPHSVHSNKATTLAKPFPEITNVSKIKKTRHRQPDQLDINSTSDVIVSAIPSTKSMSKPTLNYLKFLESGGTFMADLEKYEIQKDLVEAQKAQIAKLQGCNVESETLIRSLDAEKHSLGNKIKKLTGLCEKYKNHMNDVVSSQRILMQEASKMRAETKAASQEGKELSSEIREILNAQDLEQKKLRGSFSQVKGELKARIDQIRQDQDLHNQLSDRITELNNSVTMKDAELGRREIDCQGMSLKIDELERHLTSIRDQLAAKSHELAALSATSRDDSQLRSRLHVLESAQKQVNQEMNGAKAEVQVLQETALQTHDKYRQQEEKLRRSEVALTSALEQISALAAASKVDIDKAKQQVAEAANASKQEIAMRHNALVMNLELRRSEADDHLKTSKEDMKRIQDENVNYAQTVASMQAEISQADEKLSRMSSRIDGLNAQISSQEQLDKRAQTSRNEAESQLNLTKEELKATQDENANYCHHIETLQTEISRSDEALGQLSEKINGLEKEVRSQEQIHEREQNISTILSELASLRAENEAFQNETDQNLSGARQTQHEVVTQLQNVESLHQTQEDLQIEKSDLQNKYNLLRSTVTQHLSQTGALQSGESLDVWAANYAPKTSRNMVQLTQSAQRFRNNGVDFGANSKALPTNSRALDLFPTPQEALENALNRRATNPRDTVLGSLPGTNLRSVGAAVRRRPETAIVPHTDVQLLPSNSHPISQFSKIKTPRVANRISSALTPLATEDRAGRMSNGETSLDIIDRSKQAGKDVGRSETSAPVTSKYTQATMTRTLHSREMTTFMVENASSDLVPYSVLAPARSQTASSLTDVEPMMDLLEAVQSQEELNHAYQTNREAWRRTSNKNNSLDHGSGILPASHFSVTEAGGAIDDHDEITASMPQHLNTLDAVGKHRAQPTGLKSALKKSTRLTHADVVVAGKKNESMGSSVSNHTSKALKDVSLSGRGRNRNATRLNITSAGSDYNRVAIGARKSSNNTELGGYVQRRPVPASPLIAAPKRNLLKRKTSAISLREQDAKRLKAQSSRTRSPRATSQSHKRLSYSTASKAAV